MTDTDIELLRRSADGDAEAFEHFLKNHQRSVMGFLESMTDCRGDAEDAFQEAFVSAWKAAGSFTGAGSAKSWLFTIARRALIRLGKKRSREPNSVESLEDLADRAGWRASDNTPTFLDRLADRDMLETALKELPSSEREVLVLRDVEGFSGKEVAEMLEITIEGMKSRLHRGRLNIVAALRRFDNG